CHDFDLALRIAFTDAAAVRAVPETLRLYRRHASQMSRNWRVMDREWNLVFEKCRALAPTEAGAVEARARANINRYFAYLAYENGEFLDARRFVRAVARHDPRGMLTDPRNWKIAAA